MGLGCGTPLAFAQLREGETVIDLGSGGGFDCFLAVRQVGASGKVVGVDMTPEMIEKARDNAERGRYENVDFRLGELEHLPVRDGEADVLISNCVINLVPDKNQVFAEAFRALRPGGRISVSDMVLLRPWPQGVRKTAESYAACLAGAVLKDEYLEAIRKAGFEDVEVAAESSAAGLLGDDAGEELAKTFGVSADELRQAIESAASIQVTAAKPI